MDVEKKLKDFFSKLKKSYSGDLSERDVANMYKLPDDCASWLNDIESYAENLPDDLPRVDAIRKYVPIARQALDEGEMSDLHLFMFRLNEAYDDTRRNRIGIRNNDRAKKERVGGSKGGKAPKRREWAELMAEEIAGVGGITEAQAWDAVPCSRNAFEANTLNVDYDVYMDGEKIVAVNQDTEKEQFLTRSTFIKNYYRPARKKHTG